MTKIVCGVITIGSGCWNFYSYSSLSLVGRAEYPWLPLLGLALLGAGVGFLVSGAKELL